MSQKNLEKLLSPKSIVIIGASENTSKVGNILLRNIVNTKNSLEVFAVNPKGGHAYGVEFTKKISEIPKIPDLAIIAIPAKFVIQSLIDCGRLGIQNIVIISAGFKEVGNFSLEEEVVDIAKKYNINILGPNCLGFLNIHKNINASFASSKPVKKGNIAMVSQSGAMAVAMMDWAQKENIGFSKIITMGNKSHINENDFLYYLAEDPETDVIVLYLESIENGQDFFKIASKISKIKPIIMVKSGISIKGSIAAASHTGALSGKKEILETALLQSGIHSTHSLQEMFLLSKIFSHFAGKTQYPENITIITNAGGPAVMAVDNAEIFNVSLQHFTEKEQKILIKNLPNASSCKNPIDILGDATSTQYFQILENLKNLEIQNKKNSVYLVLLTQQSMTDSVKIAKVLKKFQDTNPEKILIASFMGGEDVIPARKILNDYGVLHFNYPREALSAYYNILQQQKLKKSESLAIHNTQEQKQKPELKEKINKLLQKEIKQNREMCSTHTVSEILRIYNIPFAEEFLCTSSKDIHSVWEKITQNTDIKTPKIVMKIASADIPHKTDIGGVILNIRSKTEAQEAYEVILKNISNAQIQNQLEKNIIIDGVSMQKMMNPNSKEVYVGFNRDAIFGDVILLGYGGIYLNIFSDISRRILPISENEIHKMLQETKFYALLQGARGEKSVDIKNLVSIIYKLSRLFIENKNISSIDINPIFANESENIIVDAKFFLEKN